MTVSLRRDFSCAHSRILQHKYLALLFRTTNDSFICQFFNSVKMAKCTFPVHYLFAGTVRMLTQYRTRLYFQLTGHSWWHQ